LLRTAAGAGVAGLAGGLVINSTAGTASASPSPTLDRGEALAAGEPMVAHVRDARTGEMDLFVGERHVEFTDRELAGRLARAVANHRA
jgi:hypothetical protein